MIREKLAMNNQLEDAQLQYDELVQELRKSQSQAQKVYLVYIKL